MIRIQRLKQTGNWIQVSVCPQSTDSLLNTRMQSIAKQKMNGYTDTVRAIDDSGALINIYHG